MEDSWFCTGNLMSLLQKIYGMGSGGPTWATGKVAVKSVGIMFDSNTYGTAEQNIPQASDIIAGDTLFAIHAEARSGSFAGPIAPSSGWTKVAGTGAAAFGQYGLYWKVADGDGSDVFRMPWNGDPAVPAVLSQMACITQDEAPLDLTMTSNLNDANDSDWDVPALAAGTPPFIDGTCVILCCVRSLEDAIFPIAGTVQDQHPVGMETLGEAFVQKPTNQEDALWLGWYFQFQDPSVAMDAFEQGYTPDPTQADDSWTSYTRYRQL